MRNDGGWIRKKGGWNREDELERKEVGGSEEGGMREDGGGTGRGREEEEGRKRSRLVTEYCRT